MSNPLLSAIGRFADSSGRFIIKWRPFALALGAAGATYSLTSAYVYDVCYSVGASMSPTIPDRTSLLGVNKTYAKGRGIKIGDCVQIASPQQPNHLAGKRVVGLPGDYVLRSKNNSPTPGGVPLPGITDWKKRLLEEHVRENDDDDEWEEPEMIQVPEGHVWLEGDNLGWSRDSRAYGPVPMALIKGRSSWYCDGFFSYTSLNPGNGLRKVEDWEKDAVLGEGR